LHIAINRLTLQIDDEILVGSLINLVGAGAVVGTLVNTSATAGVGFGIRAETSGGETAFVFGTTIVGVFCAPPYFTFMRASMSDTLLLRINFAVTAGGRGVGLGGKTKWVGAGVSLTFPDGKTKMGWSRAATLGNFLRFERRAAAKFATACKAA
jgi:hypothetical protein